MWRAPRQVGWGTANWSPSWPKRTYCALNLLQVAFITVVSHILRWVRSWQLLVLVTEGSPRHLLRGILFSPEGRGCPGGMAGPSVLLPTGCSKWAGGSSEPAACPPTLLTLRWACVRDPQVARSSSPLHLPLTCLSHLPTPSCGSASSVLSFPLHPLPHILLFFPFPLFHFLRRFLLASLPSFSSSSASP